MFVSSIVTRRELRTDANGDSRKLPSVETIRSLIESEISVIENEQKRPGWTLWALVGSLGAVLWLLTAEELVVKLARPQPQFVAIVAVLGLGIVQLLRRVESIQSLYARLGLRFLPAHRESGVPERAVDALSVIGVAAVCYAHSQYLGPLGGPAKWTYVVLSVAALVNLFKPRSIQKSAPVESGTIWWAWAFIALIFFVIYMPVAAILLYGRRVLDFTGSDLRTGALLAVAVQLLTLLAATERVSPALVELRQLRRDLLLGRCSITEAIDRFDATMNGMRLGDVLREEIREFVDLERIARQLLADAQLLVDVAKCMPTLDRVSSARRALERVDRSIESLGAARVPIESKVKKLLVHTDLEALRVMRNMFDTVASIGRQCIELWDELDGLSVQEATSGGLNAVGTDVSIAVPELAELSDVEERVVSDEGGDWRKSLGAVNALVRRVNGIQERLVTMVDELKDVYEGAGDAAIDVAVSADDAQRRLNLVDGRYGPLWDSYAKARRLWYVVSAELMSSRVACEMKESVELSDLCSRVDLVETSLARLEKEFRRRARL